MVLETSSIARQSRSKGEKTAKMHLSNWLSYFITTLLTMKKTKKYCALIEAMIKEPCLSQIVKKVSVFLHDTCIFESRVLTDGFHKWYKQKFSHVK